MLTKRAMRDYFITTSSMSELLQTMGKDVRTFFKQEIKLVKTEMSERISRVARDAIVLGLGNLMAGTGSILMLAGIAFLVAYAFQTTGLNPLLAMFLGFLIIGFLVLAVGAAMSLKGIKALSKDSLAPLRTLHAVSGVEIETQTPGRKEPSAAQLHGEALATKQRITEERRELTHRISGLQLKDLAVEQIKKHPLSFGSAALACVLTSSYFIGRKFWRTA
jgi:hypothetical protein